MGFSYPLIPENFRHGLSARRRSSSTTPRTHFFAGALRLARSKAAWRATDHLMTVFGLSVPTSFRLLGYWDRQFLGFRTASCWNRSQTSGVATVIGERPVISRKAEIASRQASSDFLALRRASGDCFLAKWRRWISSNSSSERGDEQGADFLPPFLSMSSTTRIASPTSEAPVERLDFRPGQ